MASISTNAKGFRRLSFKSIEGKPQTIYLNKTPMRACETIKTRVELLLVAKASNSSIDLETAKWLTSIAPDLRRKLSAKGLCEPPEEDVKAEVLTLGKHLANYFDKRKGVKKSTQTNWGHTKRCLLKFFSADKELASITPGDAKDFERWLKTSEARENRYAESEVTDGLAHNTARKRISNAKQFFQDAVERELLSRNPFHGLKGSVGANRSRDYFVTTEEAQKVIDACPDAKWRFMFAMARWGGLRVPSEILELRWTDILWDQNRFVVHSPKTEHHQGGESRVCPIFPELRPFLDELWEMADGQEFIINRYRDPTQNLRTRLGDIIRKAGLKVWPKLWVNLRASRATELANQVAGHKAAAWLGHSNQIADKHYRQVTDEDFAQASATTTRQTTRNTSDSTGKHRNPPDPRNENRPENPVIFRPVPICSNLVQDNDLELMGDTGLETLPCSSIKTALSQTDDAPDDALSTISPLDSGLETIIQAWPRLDEPTRLELLALVRNFLR